MKNDVIAPAAPQVAESHNGAPRSRAAVWTAARAAVKRRRLQTFAVGLVVMVSATAVVLGLALLLAASAPFDRAFAHQHGAHAVATFDGAKISEGDLAQTARRPGVSAAAGPFGQTTLQIPNGSYGTAAGPLVVVGRADPGGPVDRVELRAGRWATRPGEIVINITYGGLTGTPTGLGKTLQPEGMPPLTIVGYVTSMSQSAGGWVTPGQMAAWRPTGWQMLYRFTSAATEDQVRHSLATAVGGAPAAALTSAQDYHVLRQAFAGRVRSLLPILSAFGALGLVVSVLIVANVVTGAVISGYRHIGILKAIGFTPRQVTTVYLTMIGIPAVLGSLIGTLIGAVLAVPALQIAFSGIQVGTATIALSPWAPAAGLAGMLVLVAASALVPAAGAGRLPAAQAISAGSAPRSGRGLRVQRALAGARMPRPVSLGLGQPLARPARSILTLAAIALGVATATLTTGLTASFTAVTKAVHANGAPQVLVTTDAHQSGHGTPKVDDARIEALLRSLPGVRTLLARAFVQASLNGFIDPIEVDFYRGDINEATSPIVTGRPPAGPGEAVAGLAFLSQHGLHIGDQVTVEYGSHRIRLTIVGETIDDNPGTIVTTWANLAGLAPGAPVADYWVTLAPGTDTAAYAAAVQAADPTLEVSSLGGGRAVTNGIAAFSVAVTVILGLVAALGVFNTVLLNIHERRRDLGVLKSIGMTPGQVVLMTLASVVALGVVGGVLGIPVGIAAHRLILDNLGTIALPESVKDVWHGWQLAGLALAGVAIALVGALVPARSAARLPVATVLHNE